MYTFWIFKLIQDDVFFPFRKSNTNYVVVEWLDTECWLWPFLSDGRFQIFEHFVTEFGDWKWAMLEFLCSSLNSQSLYTGRVLPNSDDISTDSDDKCLLNLIADTEEFYCDIQIRNVFKIRETVDYIINSGSAGLCHLAGWPLRNSEMHVQWHRNRWEK